MPPPPTSVRTLKDGVTNSCHNCCVANCILVVNFWTISSEGGSSRVSALGPRLLESFKLMDKQHSCTCCCTAFGITMTSAVRLWIINFAAHDAALMRNALHAGGMFHTVQLRNGFAVMLETDVSAAHDWRHAAAARSHLRLPSPPRADF
jgi:hypothetical protein